MDKRDTFFVLLSLEFGSNDCRNSVGQISLTILRLNVVDSIVVPDSIVEKIDFFVIVPI